MATPRESAPISASHGSILYTLVFVDDQPGAATVLMRVLFDSGRVHEERVLRCAADVKLKTLIGDEIDARLHEILSDVVNS